MGDGEDGVGAELGFVFGAVDGDHGRVDKALIAGVHAGEFRTEDGLDVFYGLENALAEVVVFISVAKFDGLVLAGGGSAGNGSAASGFRRRERRQLRLWGCRGSREFSRAWIETISVMLLLYLGAAEC